MAALARHVAGDDELLGRSDLELEPSGRATACLVPAAPVLGHRAFQALLGGGGEERDAIACDLPAEADARMLAEDQSKDRRPVFQRHVEIGAAGAPEQVECHEDERRSRVPPREPVELMGTAGAPGLPPSRAWSRPKSGRPRESARPPRRR